MVFRENPQSAYDDTMVAAMRKEWGLDGDTPRIVGPAESLISNALQDKTNFRLGVHDSFLLSGLTNPLVKMEEKAEIVEVLTHSIFDKEQPNDTLVPSRTGKFLGALAALVEDKTTDQELKDVIKDAVTSHELRRSLDESAQNKWDAADVNGVVAGFSTLQTLEEMLGSTEAQTTLRRVQQSAVAGRKLDEFLERGARDVGSEGRGFSIWLGVRGAELAETIIKDAYLRSCRGSNLTPHISPYYRNIVLTTHFSSDINDPDGDLLTPAQTFGQQFRTKVEGVRGAAELPVAAKVNNKHEVTILPAKPQVGLNLPDGAGFAIKLQDEARRAGKERCETVLNVLGDGALPMLSRTLQILGSEKAPAIQVILNNKMAIGVEQNDVWGGTTMDKTGEGYGVPGIHVGLTEFEKLYLATYFAAEYSAMGGGSLILDVETVRLAPHSNAHGNSQGAKLIHGLEEMMTTLEGEMLYTGDTDFTQLHSELQLIGAKPGLLEVRRDLESFLAAHQQEPVIQAMENEIKAGIENIVDPSEIFERQYSHSLWTVEENLEWQKAAMNEIAEAFDMAKEAERPTSADKFNNYDRLYPHASEWSFPGVLKLTGADAERLALLEALSSHPNMVYMGADVNKGPNYHVSIVDGVRHVDFYTAGGYWNQSRDLATLYPDKVRNTIIDEWTVTAMLMGYGLSSTHPDVLKNAPIAVFHGQYKDYGDYLMQAMKDLGSLMLTTDGQMTRRFLYLATAGMTPGGGTGHAREDMGYSFMAPYEVPIFYPSRPSDTYQLLSHLFRNGLYTPTIFAWDRNCWNKEQSFTFDPNIVPGRARVAREGDGLQILTFGPSVNTSMQAIENGGIQGAGILDLFTIRPFPVVDVYNFLSKGHGPIAIVQEDPRGQGFGDIMVNLLLDDPKLREIVTQRGVYRFGSDPISAIPCDKIYQDAIKPDLVTSFRQILNQSN